MNINNLERELMKLNKKLQAIADKLINLMKEYGTGWTKSWSSGEIPKNLVSKRDYSGINIPLLMMRCMESGFKSHFWASFKQWNDKGYLVTGKAEPIVFWKSSKSKDKTDKNTGETVEGKKWWMLRYYNVWNSDQVIKKDYLSWITCNYKYKVDKPKPVSKVECIKNIDTYIANTKAVVKHGYDSAFYSPSKDFIGMPDKDDFLDTKFANATGNYYGVKTHELGHWTGHKSRLDRKQVPLAFEKDAYAYEELIAEISSAMLSVKLGLDHEPRPDHAQYLSSWLGALDNDNSAIISACGKASKVIEYLDDLQVE